jgi:hypothetical protein
VSLQIYNQLRNCGSKVRKRDRAGSETRLMRPSGGRSIATDLRAYNLVGSY